MSDLTLYFSPGACSRVTMNALEEIGLSYETQLINVMKNEAKSAEYLAINPKGVIPALKVGQQLLAENAAILYHLHGQFPEAKLLPKMDCFGDNKGLEDLIWCASTLHPMTRMVRMPKRFSQGDTEGIVALGKQYWLPVLDMLSQRFENSQWWYGDSWSIMDVYLYWAYMVAASGGLDLSHHKSIFRHATDVQSRSSYQGALKREMTEMEKHQIDIPQGWQ